MNYHYRTNYESLLFRLMKQAGHRIPEHKLSKRFLFEHLNYYLIMFDCIPFTSIEIEKIKLL